MRGVWRKEYSLDGPFELWDSVRGCVPGVYTGGIVCPQCFVSEAWDQGLTDVNWSLIPVPKGFCVKVPLEGRVVPRYHYFAGEPRELLRQWYASFVGSDGRPNGWPSNSADLAQTTTGRLDVCVHPVLRLDLESLVATLVRVVHGRIFYRRRVVVSLRHLRSPHFATRNGWRNEATTLTTLHGRSAESPVRVREWPR